MRNDKPNLIVDLTFKFALNTIEFCDELEKHKKFPMSKQFFKSGTSIGANVMEAQNAQSKADFIHKLKIAAKEADETMYWIKLCNLSKSYPTNNELAVELASIINVLSKIISTTKNN